MPNRKTQPAAAGAVGSSIIARNLAYLLHQWNISQSLLGRRADVKQPTINRILHGKEDRPYQETVQKLANYFGISSDDLRYRDLTSLSLLPRNLRGSRIRFVHASEAGQSHAKGENIMVIHDVSPSGYAFAVADRAMEPRFYLEDVVVVDPEQSFGPGNFVAARVAGLAEAVVRQLGQDESMLELLPLNKYYPALRAERILGKVVSRQEHVF